MTAKGLSAGRDHGGAWPRWALSGFLATRGIRGVRRGDVTHASLSSHDRVYGWVRGNSCLGPCGGISFHWIAGWHFGLGTMRAAIGGKILVARTE